MKGQTVFYLGRPIQKEHFRTFIYDANDNKKCVESWQEFEEEMASGIWFDTLEKAQEAKESIRLAKEEEEKIVVPKARKQRTRTLEPTPKEAEDSSEVVFNPEAFKINEDAGSAPKKDDFFSDAG